MEEIAVFFIRILIFRVDAKHLNEAEMLRFFICVCPTFACWCGVVYNS